MKFQSIQNWLKLQCQPNFASKLMYRCKIEQLLTSKLEKYKIAQFLGTLLGDLFSKTLKDRRNFNFRDNSNLKTVFSLSDHTTIVGKCGL